jgi:hypothetical protein
VGGLPVFAHPTYAPGVIGEWVRTLAAEGLAGIECFYKDYDASTMAGLLSLCVDHGLFATGGTDFHGTGNWAETGPGSRDVPWTVAQSIFKAADRPLPAAR